MSAAVRLRRIALQGALLLGLAALLNWGTTFLPDSCARAAAPPPLLDALLVQAAPAAEDGIAVEGARRLRALRLAAQGWGSQAGLARRSWELRALMQHHDVLLSAAFRFRALAQPVAGGFWLIPPVAVETGPALRVSADGRQATAARRVIELAEPARLALQPRHWSDWLERDWPAPAPPPAALWPREPAEQAAWEAALRAGWEAGTLLADDTLLADLAALERAFTGQVGWRLLRLQGMATAPALRHRHAPVAGSAPLRIGETAVEIARDAGLNPEWSRWTPPGGGS